VATTALDDEDDGAGQGRDRRDLVESYMGLTMEELTRIGFRVAMNRLNSQEDRKDVLQEAFLRVIMVAQRGDPRPDSPKAFFAKIVDNKIIEIYRSRIALKNGQGITTASLDEGYGVADKAPLPEQRAMAAELHDRIVAAIATLTSDHLAGVELAVDIDSGDFHRISHAEIAARLGIETKTVKHRIHEAKKQLAIRLADWRKEDVT
jgi:RNA polymerase sigma factor (sigma-70 family)